MLFRSPARLGPDVAVRVARSSTVAEVDGAFGGVAEDLVRCYDLLELLGRVLGLLLALDRGRCGEGDVWVEQAAELVVAVFDLAGGERGGRRKVKDLPGSWIRMSWEGEGVGRAGRCTPTRAGRGSDSMEGKSGRVDDFEERSHPRV